MEKNSEKISKGSIIVSLILATAGAIVSIILSLTVPSFRETFESFGTDLPFVTDLVVSAEGVYVWLAGVCVAVAVCAIAIRVKPVLIVSCVFSGLLVLLLPIAMVALYLPVFTMGNT